MTHTKTPWRIMEREKDGSVAITAMNGSDPLYHVLVIPDGKGTEQIDAAFIVRAVNNHDALLAALKDAAGLITVLLSTYGDSGGRVILANILNVLAAAERQEKEHG